MATFLYSRISNLQENKVLRFYPLKLLNRFECVVSKLQGKGYGTALITEKNSCGVMLCTLLVEWQQGLNG